MAIEVNGKKIDWIKGESIKRLLKRMNYTFPMIVVKVNGKLVKKIEFEDFIIEDNDKISAIHLISGG